MGVIDFDLHRALAYPYAIPSHSFLYENGTTRVLADPAAYFASAEFRAERRTPVIGAGSNCAPEQIVRKFAGRNPGPIPAVRGELHDYDSVYSNHVSGYGAIPATLSASPGTIVNIFVLYLNAVQLEIMHATEAVGRNYEFVHFGPVRLDVEGGGRLDDAYAYQSLWGVLDFGAGPAALSAVPARRRSFQAMAEAGMAALARDHLAPGESLESFLGSRLNQGLV